jgi:hypothetical protein
MDEQKQHNVKKIQLNNFDSLMVGKIVSFLLARIKTHFQSILEDFLKMLQCEESRSDCSAISLTPNKQSMKATANKPNFFFLIKAIPLIQTIEQLLKNDLKGDAKFKKRKVRTNEIQIL